MNADWYYLKRRWYGGSKKVGPLHEHELLHRIDIGEITPDTLLMSSKTRQHWVKMSQVAPAMEHWQWLQHPTHPHGGHGSSGHIPTGHGSPGHGSPMHGHGPAHPGGHGPGSSGHGSASSHSG
jgi:hypothetical protein